MKSFANYIRFACFPLIAAACSLASAEDWPTYMHDNQRSGITAESLVLQDLQERWAYTSPSPPQTAWGGPAPWDAYAGIIGLAPMRNFDPAFFVTAVGDVVYFGSSADNSVYCLDAVTGLAIWSFLTAGSVRFPPAISGGKAYFGSDDGYAYCVNATNGSLMWRYRPSPSDRLIPSNGKFISVWPVRTGVLVQDGKAYFAASLLPWRESYLCAVDAATGSNSGPGLYKATHAQSTMQAALLASPTKLYVSHGRRHPHVYNRSDGSHLGAFGETGDGGVYALLTADSHYLEGRGQNHDSGGEVREHNADSRDHIATFRGGNGMVVSGNTAYVLKNDSLSAIDRTTPGQLWSVSFNYPYSLILAGNVLFAGGDGEVAAVSTANGATLWTGTVMGKAYGLAVANGRLFVSTDRGTIYCFSTRADLTSTGDWWKLFR